jgi:hypothetical protein
VRAKQLEEFVRASRGVADCPDSRYLLSGLSWTRSGHISVSLQSAYRETLPSPL